MIPKRLWGNSLNEAVAAGCLALANPDSMPNNRSLLMPRLNTSDWESMIRLLENLKETVNGLKRNNKSNKPFQIGFFVTDLSQNGK